MNFITKNQSSNRSVHFLICSIFLPLIPLIAADSRLPECGEIPKVLCCTERVLEKCLSGCIDYVTQKCPHKLASFETIQSERPARPNESSDEANGEDANEDERPPIHNEVKPKLKSPRYSSHSKFSARKPSKKVSLSDYPMKDGESNYPKPPGIRRSPKGGDYKLLNPDYPVTEVSDADLTAECGTEKSQPPYSPCLSRKTVDDLFVSCCQQHVPSNCHSLCTYEHREQVAAQTLISVVQNSNCDLKHISSILYCANQNRNNRKCCEYLGLSSNDLGVGNRSVNFIP
ncbi:hypothetical protein WR25_22730 isoform A [Diploscapter pachys]|uniref:Domain of unknown function DB domain-containing protein n=1 Tax=Diploscapter pachys TaxID=2018661 RepID=A0A2A2KUS8_9BILA|nr:hypothetical protein WR25_22730 isoform A [Diploscapter pachys]